MRLSIIISISIISFLFTGYRGISVDSQVNQSTKKVTFKLIKAYGADTKPKEAMLSMIMQIVTDDRQNLYVLDKDDRLLSFKPDGGLRWVIEKKGEGPGDLSHSSGIATDGNKYLYISNVNGSRIDRFDLNGKFTTSFNTSKFGSSTLTVVGYVKPNWLVVKQYPYGKIGADLTVFEIGNGLKIKSHFVVDQTGDVKLLHNPGIWVGVHINGDKIAIGNCVYYKIFEYDISGKQAKAIKKDFKKLAIYSGKKGMGVYSGVSSPYRISKSYYLCSLWWPTNTDDFEKNFRSKVKRDFNNMIDIFDEKGNPVSSIQTKGRTNPDIGEPYYSDSEGYLYTFKELPYPQICKYKVIIENKK